MLFRIDRSHKRSDGIYSYMGRRVSITPEKEEEIIAALEVDAHASRVARKLGVSFSTVWRRAERAGIELTAGREAKGYKRLPAEQYAKIMTVRQANPQATQEEVARRVGVSRPTVSRVTRGHNRRAVMSRVG
jgi:transposase-like protein